MPTKHHFKIKFRLYSKYSNENMTICKQFNNHFITEDYKAMILVLVFTKFGDLIYWQNTINYTKFLISRHVPLEIYVYSGSSCLKAFLRGLSWNILKNFLKIAVTHLRWILFSDNSALCKNYKTLFCRTSTDSFI